MPNIQKIFTLEVTPEKFLQACTPQEIYELHLQLQSPRYQNIIDRVDTDGMDTAVESDLELVWYDPAVLPADPDEHVKCSHCRKPIFPDQKKAEVLVNDDHHEAHLHTGCYLKVIPYLRRTSIAVKPPADRIEKHGPYA